MGARAPAPVENLQQFVDFSGSISMIQPHPSLLNELENLEFGSGTEMLLGSFEVLDYLMPQDHSIIEYLLLNPPSPLVNNRAGCCQDNERQAASPKLRSILRSKCLPDKSQ